MTSRFKDFGSESGASTEPLSFMIHGETFECYPAMQGKKLLSLVATTEGGDTAAVVASINSFFETTLKPESYTRFDLLMDDPERIVSVEALGDITAWLVEEYTNRPTKESSDS